MQISNPEILRHCILTAFNIFVFAVSNLRGICLRDDADFEVNPIYLFILTKTHSIIKFDEVNLKGSRRYQAQRKTLNHDL